MSQSAEGRGIEEVELANQRLVNLQKTEELKRLMNMFKILHLFNRPQAT